jgi:hypothetical protein
MAQIVASEASLLLSKWYSDGTVMLLNFEDGDVTFAGLGSISSLGDGLVVFEREPLFKFTIKLSKVARFEYSDVREESDEIREAYGQLVDHKLLLHMPLGSYVRIYTRKPKDERTG